MDASDSNRGGYGHPPRNEVNRNLYQEEAIASSSYELPRYGSSGPRDPSRERMSQSRSPLRYRHHQEQLRSGSHEARQYHGHRDYSRSPRRQRSGSFYKDEILGGSSHTSPVLRYSTSPRTTEKRPSGLPKPIPSNPTEESYREEPEYNRGGRLDVGSLERRQTERYSDSEMSNRSRSLRGWGSTDSATRGRGIVNHRSPRARGRGRGRGARGEQHSRVSALERLGPKLPSTRGKPVRNTTPIAKHLQQQVESNCDR